MKKIFNILLIGSMLTICNLYALPSGVFIGASLGANANKAPYGSGSESFSVVGNTTSHTVTSDIGVTTKLQMDYGLRLGYIWGINNYNAFKITVNYDYSSFFDVGFMQAGFSVDYMLSFNDKPNAWGMFIGGGYDWGFYKWGNYLRKHKNNGNNVNVDFAYLQLGFFKAFGEDGNTMLQFGLKYPFGNYDKQTISTELDSITSYRSNLYSLFIALNYTF